jgi:tRNA modification GTPase
MPTPHAVGGDGGAARDAESLFVVTKADLCDRDGHPAVWLRTSGRTGLGIAELRRQIAQTARGAAQRRSGNGTLLPSTVSRCREGLRLAADSLELTGRIAAEGGGEELLAAELRCALDQIDRLLGHVCPDELLHHIFSRFCIGK